MAPGRGCYCRVAVGVKVLGSLSVQGLTSSANNYRAPRWFHDAHAKIHRCHDCRLVPKMSCLTCDGFGVFATCPSSALIVTLSNKNHDLLLLLLWQKVPQR